MTAGIGDTQLLEFVSVLNIDPALGSLAKLQGAIKTAASNWSRQTALTGANVFGNPKNFVQLSKNIGAINSVLKNTSQSGVITGSVLDKAAAGGSLEFQKMGSSMTRSLRFDLINSQIDQFSTHIISMGKNVQWLGRQMTVGLTVPIVAAGIKAVTTFETINKEFTRLQKVIGSDVFNQLTTDAGFAGEKVDILDKAIINVSGKLKQISGQTFTFNGTKTVGDNLKDLAKQLSQTYGISQSITAGIIADWASMGYQAKNLGAIVSNVFQVATTGDIQLSQASELFRTTLAIFAQGAAGIKDTGQAIAYTHDQMAALNQVADKTSLFIQDLSDAFPIAAKSAELFGLNAGQLAAILAGMRQQGVQATDAANALKFAFVRMEKPTTKAADSLKNFTGIDLTSNAEKNVTGLTKILQIATAVSKLSKGDQLAVISDVFGQRQVNRVKTLFDTVTQGTAQIKAGGVATNDFARAMEALGASKKDIDKAFAQKVAVKLESPETELAKAKTTFQNIMGELGKTLIADVVPAFSELNKILQKIVNMPDPLKKVVVGISVFLAAMGPVILITGLLTSVFGVVTKAGSNFATLLKKLIPGGASEMDASIKLTDITTGKFADTLVSILGKFYQFKQAGENSFSGVAASVETSMADINASVGSYTDATAASATTVKAAEQGIAENVAATATVVSTSNDAMIASNVELAKSFESVAAVASTPATSSFIPFVERMRAGKEAAAAKRAAETKSTTEYLTNPAIGVREPVYGPPIPQPKIPAPPAYVGEIIQRRTTPVPEGGYPTSGRMPYNALSEGPKLGPPIPAELRSNFRLAENSITEAKSSIGQKLRSIFFLPQGFDFGVGARLKSIKNVGRSLLPGNIGGTIGAGLSHIPGSGKASAIGEKISNVIHGQTAKDIATPFKDGAAQAAIALNPKNIFKDFSKHVEEESSKTKGIFKGLFGSIVSIAKGPLKLLTGSLGSVSVGAEAIIPSITGAVAAFSLFTGAIVIIGGIVVAIMAIKKHWSEIYAAMKPGIKDIEKAFDGIKTAVGNIVGVFTKAIAGPLGGNGVGQSGDIWKTLGGDIATAMSGIAHAMDAVALLINKTAPLFKYLGTIVGDEIGFISALFHGDWKNAFAYAYQIVFNIFAKPWVILLDGIVKAFFIMLSKIVGGLNSFATKIPFVGGKIHKFLNNIEDDIKHAGDSFNLDDFLGNLIKPSGIPASAGNRDGNQYVMGFKKTVPDGVPTIKPAVDPASLAAANDQLTKFLSSLQSELDASVNQVKTAATNAFNAVIAAKQKAFDDQQTYAKNLFDAYSQAKLKTYDDQVAAINKLSAADQNRYNQEQYLAQRRQLLLDAQTNKQNYEQARALAIYEGHTDDARMLDLQHSADLQNQQQSLSDLDSQHNRDLVAQQRQAQIDQINAQKDAEQKKLDIQKNALDKQLQNQADAFAKNIAALQAEFSRELDVITKHTPENVAQYKNELDQINALMVKFGGSPQFPQAGQTAMTAFGDAVKAAQKDIVDDAFWAGNAAGLAMAAGFNKGAAGVGSSITGGTSGAGGSPGSSGSGSPGKTTTVQGFDPKGGNKTVVASKDIVEKWMRALTADEVAGYELTDKGQSVVSTLYKVGGVGRTGIVNPIAMGNALIFLQLLKPAADGVTVDWGATNNAILTKLFKPGGGQGYVPKKHDGGVIGAGKGGKTDEADHRLQVGEYVISKKAARSIGYNTLDMINSLSAPAPQMAPGFVADKNMIQKPVQDFFSKMPENAYKWTKQNFTEYSNKIKDLWKTHFMATKDENDKSWILINRTTQQSLDTSNSTVRNGLQKVKTTTSSSWQDMTSTTQGFWALIVNAVNSGVNTVTGKVGTAPSQWGGAFGGIKGAFGVPVNFVLSTIMPGLENQLNTFTNSMGLGTIFKEKFVSVPVKHDGGVVGQENKTRKVSLSGAGVKNDEQITLLQKGEVVVPKTAATKTQRIDQQRNIDNAPKPGPSGTSPAPVVNPVAGIQAIIAQAGSYKTSPNMHKVVGGAAYTQGVNAIGWMDRVTQYINLVRPQTTAGGTGTGGTFVPGPERPASKGVSDYINLILPYVDTEARRTEIQPSVMLSQSGNETGWGTSPAWRKYLNPAGLNITGPGVMGNSFKNIGDAFHTYANRLMGIGEYGQGPFVALVKSHAPSIDQIKALEASPWAASHYGGHGLESIWYNYGLKKYDIPGLKDGGIVPPRLGGSTFKVAEAGVHEAVIPLTKPNIDKMFKFPMPQTPRPTIPAPNTNNSWASHTNEEHYHFKVETFVGEKEWFEQFMKEFHDTKGRISQRSRGEINRKMGSYKDNTVRYNRG